MGLMLVSCENFLDRQTISDLSKDKYWQTEQDLMSWNAGMYDGLQSTLRTNWFDWGELRGGTYIERGTSFDANLLYNGLTSNAKTSSWETLYATIYRANAIIKHAPTMPVDDKVRNPYLAQAYTMRALMYFYAIRVWGDVPKVTEPYEDVTTQEKYYPRTSILDIKELMLDDLTEAIRLFGKTDNLSAASKYFLNKGAALALKTDILVWYKEFDEAIKAANELIACGYELTQGEKYREQFLSPETSPEMIFNLYWDFTEDGEGFGYAKAVAAGGSKTIMYHPTEEIFKELVERKREDKRTVLVMDTLYIYKELKDYFKSDKDKNNRNNITAAYYKTGWDKKKDKFQIRCPKFANYNSAANNGAGGYDYPVLEEDNTRMPIYRLADIMLLKAEALAQCSTPDLQGAINIVNDIRKRAGWTKKATLTDYPTADDVIDLIIDERIIEFWAEGKHWFDLVRNNRVKKYVDEFYKSEYSNKNYIDLQELFVIGVDEPANPIGGYGRILWPLNQDVFRKNPNMQGQQNKPYTE